MGREVKGGITLIELLIVLILAALGDRRTAYHRALTTPSRTLRHQHRRREPAIKSTTPTAVSRRLGDVISSTTYLPMALSVRWMAIIPWMPARTA